MLRKNLLLGIMDAFSDDLSAQECAVLGAALLMSVGITPIRVWYGRNRRHSAEDFIEEMPLSTGEFVRAADAPLDIDEQPVERDYIKTRQIFLDYIFSLNRAPVAPQAFGADELTPAVLEEEVQEETAAIDLAVRPWPR